MLESGAESSKEAGERLLLENRRSTKEEGGQRGDPRDEPRQSERQCIEREEKLTCEDLNERYQI